MEAADANPKVRGKDSRMAKKLMAEWKSETRVDKREFQDRAVKREKAAMEKKNKRGKKPRKNETEADPSTSDLDVVAENAHQQARRVERSIITYNVVKAEQNHQLVTEQIKQGWLRNHQGEAVAKFRNAREEKRKPKSFKQFLHGDEDVEDHTQRTGTIYPGG